MTEEWKGQIPVEAISYIQDLEQKFERSQKESKEYQIKLGTSENELEKGKQRYEEIIGDNKSLEREVNKLHAENEEFAVKLRSAQASVTNKDNIISDLQAEVARSRSELTEVKSINGKLVGQLENLESEQCQSNDQKNDDIEKLKELKFLNEQRLQGYLFFYFMYTFL